MCEFLHEKFNEGYNSNTLNTMRSSIIFFTLNSLNLEEDILIKKLFKYFFNFRPLKPKYTTFWPVSKLLEFLKTWFPIDSLDLKKLTLKTIALMALTSSDRGQTLHLASPKSMTISEDKVEFIILDRTKTTRKVLRPIIISCVSSTIPELDVANHVKAYLNLTKDHRKFDDKLFLSWKTLKPVSRQTLSRWLTTVLKSARINTDKYQAHSYRGSGLSKALKSGASVSQIVFAGNWSNSSTFFTHYNAPSDDSEIGRIILES